MTKTNFWAGSLERGKLSKEPSQVYSCFASQLQYYIKKQKKWPVRSKPPANLLEAKLLVSNLPRRLLERVLQQLEVSRSPTATDQASNFVLRFRIV